MGPNRWIVSPRFDLAWFIGGAATGYGMLALHAVFGLDIVMVWFAWFVLLDSPHFFATWSRTYLDREEWEALRFAWRIGAHVKSNTVIFTDVTRTLAIGAGQMSRVDAVNVAIMKARASGADPQRPLTGSVAASDAFFPFRDGLDAVAAAGATAVVQPGGSVRDAEVIAAAELLRRHLPTTTLVSIAHRPGVAPHHQRRLTFATDDQGTRLESAPL